MNDATAKKVVIRWLKMRLRLTFKIFSTNWINVMGLFLATWISSIVYDLFYYLPANYHLPDLLILYLVGMFLQTILFNTHYCIIFLVLIFLLDFILIDRNYSKLKPHLLIQWAIISIPYTIRAIDHDHWTLLIIVVSFLITQLARKKKILARFQQPRTLKNDYN